MQHDEKINNASLISRCVKGKNFFGIFKLQASHDVNQCYGFCIV